jgi:hypothetical protein
MSECKQCGIEGYPGPPLLAGEFPLGAVDEYVKIKEIKTLLFSHSGDHYCYPCHCLVTNTCFVCSEVVDYLYNDKRCKSLSYVCEDCLKSPTTNHLWRCYKNGCMTIEEIAQAEFEELSRENQI